MTDLKFGSYGFESLKDDDIYKLFLSKTFDSTSCVFSTGVSINEQIAKINSGIDIINYDLHALVSERYEDLLLQANKIEKLDDYVQRVNSNVNNLLELIERLRSRLTEPYNRFAHRVFLLSRLQRTCDLLRKIIRVVHLSKRLRQYSSDDKSFSISKREIVKVSQYLSELKGVLCGDQSLKDVEVIAEDLLMCETVENYVLQQTDDMLSNGLQKQDQSQLSSAFQVLQNLGILEEKIEKIITEKEEAIISRIKETFDIKSLTQSKSSGPGGVAIAVTVTQVSNLKGKLWESLGTLVEYMYVNFAQLQCISKMLKKKEDAVSRNNLVNIVSRINITLSETMSKAVNESGYVKEALELEYPRLIHVFSELWKRINIDDDEVNMEQFIRRTLKPYESAYLSRSLSLLHDAVNMVFADALESAGAVSLSKNEAVVPSAEDIDTIVKAIKNELNVANVDENLKRDVCKLIGKTVQIFNVKCEQLTCNDGDSTQVIDRPSSGQLLNATLAHRLVSFKNQVGNLTSNMNVAGVNVIEMALSAVDQLIRNIIDPLNVSILDAIEAIILTMHQEDFKSKAASNTQCSLYMKELEAFLTRVDSDYLQLYPDCSVVRECALLIASRTTDLFIRHACLVRPIETLGRARLAVDCVRLEEALTRIKWLSDAHGKFYRTLRIFKPLLFQEAKAIASSPAVGTQLPVSTVITLLIANFGPPEMKLPHEVKGWSLSRYSRWLDECPQETEILYFLKISLETYEKQIRQVEGKAFAPLYPIVLKLLRSSF